MRCVEERLGGVKLLEPTVFGDERGHFYEAYNQRVMSELGINEAFVQDNQSRSCRGILRGLHYQIKKPQAKLVRCIRGEIFDVAVDIRVGSPTYGHWYGVHLSSANKRLLWVPQGLAHGFLVLSEEAEVHYKVTEYWHREFERGLRWNDPSVRIDWPAQFHPYSLNARDAGFPSLSDITFADRPQFAP